ncbi:MAG: cysteine synthase [candidate division Zixibacteria bacterium DG_27]|nr:MAG: cysteine synthase [candidate division Zixibacteria bacterium DG_27]
MLLANILESIGGTPLVKINRLTSPEDATLYAKLEFFNPCSSVKDRIGVSMIEVAEREGKLKAGMTVVEPTSGNTGIALAMVAAVKGYRTVFTMPESMSKERRSLLKHLGAQLVLTPAEKGMGGAVEKAEELASREGYFQPQQFKNPANPLIHKLTTAPEIIADLGDLNLDAFVAGVGTGGTLSGAGAVLKERYGCKVIAVEPEDSPVLSGGAPGPHPIQGIGPGFIPETYDPTVVDEIIKVSSEEAFETAKALAKQEGILAGISSGAATSVALGVCKKLGVGAVVVTILPDTAERYLSTELFSD